MTFSGQRIAPKPAERRLTCPIVPSLLIPPLDVTVKAAHVIELRTAIDIRRALVPLPPVTWIPSDPHNMTIQRADIQQMRDRLDDALPGGSYTDQPLTGYPANSILIKKQHIQELRDRVQ